MRGALLCLWLLVPAVALAYHYGPGQAKLQADDAAAFLRAAQSQAEAGHWQEACQSYDAALAQIPADRKQEIREVRLARAVAMMQCAKLPEAYDELFSLVEEVENDPQTPAKFATDARHAQASAQYYMTWLMRLEGRPAEDWEPVIESSRQSYRDLAEQATKANDLAAAASSKRDLEAAIRLARLDLAELQALPIPRQCKGCCSGNCRCKGKGKKPSMNHKPSDGAGIGPPPDGSGN